LGRDIVPVIAAGVIPLQGGSMTVGIKRRLFISALGGAAFAWSLAAHAQQSALPVVGFLNGASPDGVASQVGAFRQGLAEAGYVEGKNVSIEYRWANDKYDRLAALADELVSSRVSVIVANSPANLVVKAATSTIPIVFTTGADPVKLGLVASLDHPGGNVTGVTQLTGEVAQKRLELLHQVVPAATDFALLVNPTDLAFVEAVSQETAAAARELGLQLHILQASSEGDFEAVFAKSTQLRAGGLVISAGVFFNSHAEKLAALAIRHSMPTIFSFRKFVADGGLMSYGGSVTESYRIAGGYAGRILKGDKPADLPVQQSTKIELFVNLKTAKSLGLTIPQALLVAADEVIE
jgi:putative tryptophan/tyrosine transport system substrate-binding protein